MSDLHQHDTDRAEAIERMEGALEDLATDDDRRDHMRGTLELIAGLHHNVTLANDHMVFGEDAFSAPDRYSRALFPESTCPVCMARTCLEQIDAAEEAEVS